MALIKPKTVMVADSDGNEKPFIISKIPAVDAREVLAKYPTSNLPKVGDYDTSREAMLIMMKYVAVEIDGRDEPLCLTTQSLIDNHVEDGEQLMRLEMQMLGYNTSFFGKGGNSDFLEGLIRKYLPLIIQTATDSLQQSFKPDTQHSQS